MQRTLMRHRIDRLEAMFVNSKADLKVLKQLEHELQFRQVPRALALLEQVQAAIAPATLPLPMLPTKPIPPPTIATAHRPDPSMGVDDAYKILKVSIASPWTEIEHARQRLVQLSHPMRVATMTPEQQSRARDEAKRVNSAYATLSVARASH